MYIFIVAEGNYVDKVEATCRITPVRLRPIRISAGAICPDRERYETRRRSWPSPWSAHKTRRMETGVAATVGSFRERSGTCRVGADAFQRRIDRTQEFLTGSGST